MSPEALHQQVEDLRSHATEKIEPVDLGIATRREATAQTQTGLTYLAKQIYIDAFKDDKNKEKKSVNASIMLAALFAEKIGDFSKIERITKDSTLSIGPTLAELSIKKGDHWEVFTVNFEEESAARSTREEKAVIVRADTREELETVRQDPVGRLNAFLADQMNLRKIFQLPNEGYLSERAMLTTSLLASAKEYGGNIATKYPTYYFGRIIAGITGENYRGVDVSTQPEWEGVRDLLIGINPQTGSIIVLDRNEKVIGSCTNITALGRLVANVQPSKPEPIIQTPELPRTPLQDLISDVAAKTTMAVTKDVSWPKFNVEAYLVSAGRERFYVAASPEGEGMKYKICRYEEGKPFFNGPLVQDWTTNRNLIVDKLSGDVA